MTPNDARTSGYTFCEGLSGIHGGTSRLVIIDNAATWTALTNLWVGGAGGYFVAAKKNNLVADPTFTHVL